MKQAAATRLAKKQARKVNNSRHRAPTDRRVVGSFSLWLVAIGVLLIFLASVSLRTRMQNIDEQTALRVPKANNAVAVMKFAWADVASSQVEPGFKIVTVDTQVLNISKQTLQLAPLNESYITDTNGTKYGVSKVELDQPLRGGEYEPQRAAIGQISYAVPQRISDPWWCYELASVDRPEVPLCFPLSDKARQY